MQERTLEDLKHDIGLLVASAESDIDDRQAPAERVLEQLLFRLRAVTEDEPEVYDLARTHALAGRIDDCRLTIEHDARVCGKPQAHR